MLTGGAAGSRRAGITLLAAICAVPLPGRAEDIAALYSASWAGMIAGEIRLKLYDEPAAYRNDIAVRSEGLPRVLTHFRGTAGSEGRLAPDRLPLPLRYDARYDLRKSRDKRLSMRFAAKAAAIIAERGPEDSSKKPPLPDQFRSNVLDPLSALTAIRHALRQGNRGTFSIPVYDGARRFDVVVTVLPKRAGDKALRLELTLRPIAGFKGETSEDGDPDAAPRPVALTVSDDSRLVPLSMRVSLFYLPLVVEFSRWCAAASPCDW